MERLYKGRSAEKKLGGGLKDMPQCERCGRPVKVSSYDYLEEEVLCASCAADVRASEATEYDYA